MSTLTEEEKKFLESVKVTGIRPGTAIIIQYKDKKISEVKT